MVVTFRISSNFISFSKVIVDTDGENCVTASFVYGGDSVERQYDIRVLQYETNNEMGGPPGCLQFLLGTVAAPHGGTVTSFNFAGGKNKKNRFMDHPEIYI